MRRIASVIALAALLVVAAATAAMAEGETVDVVSQNCDGITVTGKGYTPGQDLLLLARAPQGEGTLTDPVTVQANADGEAPTTTLAFGGPVPDGTYLAVITTPGPGEREEVTTQFTVSGCAPGSVGKGADDQDCADFASQARAQEHLDSEPSDPDNLDTDHDGKACELFDFSANPDAPTGNPPDQGTALPFTGAHTVPAAALGGILLAAGLLLIRWGRRASM